MMSRGTAQQIAARDNAIENIHCTTLYIVDLLTSFYLPGGKYAATIDEVTVRKVLIFPYFLEGSVSHLSPFRDK